MIADNHNIKSVRVVFWTLISS